MTTQQRVQQTMKIWQQFCHIHGGRDRLTANILWRWPAYLTTHQLAEKGE
jgi:hypothetical protein